MNQQERIVINNELAKAGFRPFLVDEDSEGIKIKYFNKDHLPYSILNEAVRTALKLLSRPIPEEFEHGEGPGWNVIIVPKQIAGNYESNQEIST